MGVYIYLKVKTKQRTQSVGTLGLLNVPPLNMDVIKRPVITELWLPLLALP